MNWWPWRRHESHASEEAEESVRQADRALADADALQSRADKVAASLGRIREVNHIAEAVIKSIQGNRP
jgi:hypothetical protein